MTVRRVVNILLSVLLVSPLWASAQEITAAAAADLQFALPDVAERFQKQTGRTVKLTYGS